MTSINYHFPNMVYRPRQTKGNVLHLSQPRLQYNWTAVFTKHPNITYRIVHFVRDPVASIISGYLYHSQDPTPEGIIWVSLSQ